MINLCAIKIIDFRLSFPTTDSFQIMIKAEGSETIGYNIRFRDKWDGNSDVPAGFLIASGYVFPKNGDVPAISDYDNGKFDEDNTAGIYVRTFSTAEWAPGEYHMLAVVHNRPGPGAYRGDSRDADFCITDDGKIKTLATPKSEGWKINGTGRADYVEGKTIRLANDDLSGKAFSISMNSLAEGDGFYIYSGRARLVQQESRGKISLIGRGDKGQWYNQWFAPEMNVLDEDWRSFFIRLFAPAGVKSFDILAECGAGSIELCDLQLKRTNWKTGRASNAPKPEYWVNMDYYDNVIMSSNLGLAGYGESAIIDYFKKCRAAGVTGVQWRVSLGGHMLYRTKGAATMFPGPMPPEKLTPEQQLLALTMREIDPLAIAVREAKKQGVRILIWMTLSDEGYTHESISNFWYPDFLIKNPQCMLMNRQGKMLPGTMCYSEPAALEYCLNIVKELLTYGADGLYLCTRSHSGVFGADKGDDYGFNPAIVAEYRKRYGVDILKSDFDTNQWRAIKSEAYDRLFSSVSKMAKKAGQEVRLGVSILTLSRGAFLANWGNTPADWRSWLKNNWIDSVVLGQYMVDVYAASREINLFHGLNLPKKKVYFWAQTVIYGKNGSISDTDLQSQAGGFAFLGADGAVYQESITLEENNGRMLDMLGQFYKAIK